MRLSYQQALAQTGILAALEAFDPHVAGTPPLGIDIATSDIDILCAYADPEAFTAAVVAACADMESFSISQWREAPRAIVARFLAVGWEFEIFAQDVPVAQQPGWRHFVVERRLIALGGAPLREAVVRAKLSGQKTEPAFARLLGLSGDPYEALLALEVQPDQALCELLARAGL